MKSKHMFLFAGDIYDIMKKKTSYSLARTKLEERKKWVTHDEMMNVTVIAESTPGPIAINCATFTGYKKAGFAGAVAATLGMVVPSFTVIYLISMFLDNFLELSFIAKAFKGIKISVGILILDAAVTMIKKCKRRYYRKRLCFALVF